MVFDSGDPRVRGDEVALDKSLLLCYSVEYRTWIESKTIYLPLPTFSTPNVCILKSTLVNPPLGIIAQYVKERNF